MLVQSQKWFAVQVFAQCERRVALILGYKGYECLLPTYEVRRSMGKKIRSLELPLFPGYVFCKALSGACGIIVTTPRVVRIVSRGGRPALIHNDEIEAVRRLTQSGLAITPFPFLKIGQRVRIESGPLTGLTGILVEIQNQRRFIVSVDTVTKSISVDIGSTVAERVHVQPQIPPLCPLSRIS